jgi:predicted tellurium resistance membrane protein TerC
MAAFFSLDALVSLLTLTVLEIVLGIDNVIFVSILVSRLSDHQKLKARRIWMLAGIAVRILLLIGISWLVRYGSQELLGFSWKENHYPFNLRNLIMLGGGLFLLYKTVREIHQKLEGGQPSPGTKRKIHSFEGIIFQIILIDMLFSFDSIITAVGLAKLVQVMILAVVIAMVLMFYFAKAIARFIHHHPTFKMLALAFLLMVGFSLFFEGLEPLHHSHIDKAYIYFAMAFSFCVEFLNYRISKKEKLRNPVVLREPQVDHLEPKGK